jgi:hypothetical protein
MATSQETRKRETPVSFRPGKLRTAITGRAVRSLTDGQVAKRDLGRYYLLLGRVALDERLTRREASWLARADYETAVDDILSGDPFRAEHIDPSDELVRIVERALRSPNLQHEIGASVKAKIHDMMPLERAALMDALDRLPSESEEQVGDPGNWAFIGIRLADDLSTPGR